MEVIVGCISQTQACIPVLTEKSRMWKEARAWVEDAKVELQTRANDLAPDWTDDAGRAFEEKTELSLADLTLWGQRIDDSQVSEKLAELAASLPGTEAVVLGLAAEYEAFMLTLNFPAAFAAQQQAGAALSTLGTRFDLAMLSMCTAAGIANPADILPGFPQITGSAADAVKTADAAVNLLTEVQSLTESLGVGSGGTLPDTSGLLDGWTGSEVPSASNPGGGGLSLAGLAPNALTPGPLVGAPSSGLSGGGMPPSGLASLPPMPLGTLGAAGGLGGMPASRAGVGKRASSPMAEIPPGGTIGSSKGAPGGGMMPPGMPQHGAGTTGTVRPGAAEHPHERSEDQRPALGTDGVATALRGRAVDAEGNGFTIPGHRRAAESDTGSLQLLEDDTWK
ncbi:hypothetical protein [Amycolatopsis keratiniphila]|uniref:PPE family domain-containing protein n=1 Tax=Amycolatopsis keratiniphila subsp. keratiniphila TaxID=227715 RepID=A0A1W2M080_9PSEU|nr:hypothetical protein [Amycolatopsis keratiniphila]ONF72561.1 hypothetical protein AVR91_0210235 [Amycolatopsis keratiniphila subsp. keratiniphila]